MSKYPPAPNFLESMSFDVNMQCPVDMTGVKGVELGTGQPFEISAIEANLGISEQHIGGNGTTQRLVGVIEHPSGVSLGIVRVNHYGLQGTVVSRLSDGAPDESGRPKRAELVGFIESGKPLFLSGIVFGSNESTNTPTVILKDTTEGGVEIANTNPDVPLRLAYANAGSTFDEDITIELSGPNGTQRITKDIKSGKPPVAVAKYVQATKHRGWSADSRDVLSALEAANKTANPEVGAAVIGFATKDRDAGADHSRGLEQDAIKSQERHVSPSGTVHNLAKILPESINIDELDTDEAAQAQSLFMRTLSPEERQRIGIGEGASNIDDFLIRPESRVEIARVLADRLDGYIQRLKAAGVYQRLSEQGRFSVNKRIYELLYDANDYKSGTPLTSVKVENFVFPSDVALNTHRTYNNTHEPYANNEKLSARDRVLQLALAQLTGQYQSADSSYDREIQWQVATTAKGIRYFMPTYPQHRASADALLFGKVNTDQVS